MRARVCRGGVGGLHKSSHLSLSPSQDALNFRNAPRKFTKEFSAAAPSWKGKKSWKELHSAAGSVGNGELAESSSGRKAHVSQEDTGKGIYFLFRTGEYRGSVEP